MTTGQDQGVAVPLAGSTCAPIQKPVSLMGCGFASITEDEAFRRCLEWCKQPRRSRLVVPTNVSILMMMRRMPRLRNVCTSDDLVVADGMPIVWATRLLGTALPERVSGVDLMARLLADGGEHGLRAFFLGAREEVVTRLVEIVRRRHPGLVVAGYRNGYFSEDEYAEVARQVRDSKADILFVGISSPFKETWCHERRKELSTPLIFCAGGSFDVLAGCKKRAPKWMQKTGMEWLWRCMMEPRRLWKRYLTTNTLFLYLFAKLLVSRFRKKGASCPTEDVEFVPADGAPQRMNRIGDPASRPEKTALAVVVPCFNETDSIGLLAEALARVERMLRRRYDVEFLLVDDGSTDDTRRVLDEQFRRRPNYSVIQHAENRGPAAAIMTGIRAARAETVCSIDADCSYDPEQLQRMIPLLEDGVDLVTASPYHPQGRVLNVPRWRLGLSRTASLLYRCVLRHKLHTYTSCFRVYRRSAVADIELENDGFVGVTELLWKLDRQGSRIVEFPAVLGARQQGESKMKLLAAVRGHLKLLRRAIWSRVRTRNVVGRPRLPDGEIQDTESSVSTSHRSTIQA